MSTLYSTFVKTGDVCFDIGAHQGTHTETFLSLGARCIVVEPVNQSAFFLRKKFSGNEKVIVVQQAVAAAAGSGEIFLCNRSEISSLSNELINFYRKEYGHRWDSSEPVELTTLDELIQKHGRPEFCKIDVEGYEVDVLVGLSDPIPCISFEFNYPFRDQAEMCIHRLEQLGFTTFNYSIFENFVLELRQWTSAAGMIAILHSLPKHYLTGDIYARSGEQ